MISMSIPKLSPARSQKKVAMPRFRKGKSDAITLAEAVRRVLLRSITNTKPFGVFAIGGRIVISNASTKRFQVLRRRMAEAFVGTYGPGLNVSDATEDLREYFKDGVVDGVA